MTGWSNFGRYEGNGPDAEAPIEVTEAAKVQLLDGIVDDIIDYENGDLDEEALVAFFQKLVDSGLAWTLQGHYGRTARDLIEAGLVTQ